MTNVKFSAYSVLGLIEIFAVKIRIELELHREPADKRRDMKESLKS